MSCFLLVIGGDLGIFYIFQITTVHYRLQYLNKIGKIKFTDTECLFSLKSSCALVRFIDIDKFIYWQICFVIKTLNYK